MKDIFEHPLYKHFEVAYHDGKRPGEKVLEFLDAFLLGVRSDALDDLRHFAAVVAANEASCETPGMMWEAFFRYMSDNTFKPLDKVRFADGEPGRMSVIENRGNRVLVSDDINVGMAIQPTLVYLESDLVRDN